MRIESTDFVLLNKNKQMSLRETMKNVHVYNYIKVKKKKKVTSKFGKEWVKSAQNSDIFMFQSIKEEHNRGARWPTGRITNKQKSQKIIHSDKSSQHKQNKLQSLPKPLRTLNIYKSKRIKQNKFKWKMEHKTICEK